MGNDLATVQELMGHDSAETTLIYIGADGAKGTSALDVAAERMHPRRDALALLA
jgi:site-specific recombinase XerD